MKLFFHFLLQFVYVICHYASCRSLFDREPEITILPTLNATICFETLRSLENEMPPRECTCSAAYIANLRRTCDVCCYKGSNPQLLCTPLCTQDIPFKTRNDFEKDIKQILVEYMRNQESLQLEKNKFDSAPGQESQLRESGVPDILEESILGFQNPSNGLEDLNSSMHGIRKNHTNTCDEFKDEEIQYKKKTNPDKNETFNSRLNDKKIQHLAAHNLWNKHNRN